MRPLIFDDSLRNGIQKLIEYAQAHRYTLADLQRLADGELPPPGDDENFRLETQFGYKIVFTIEEQPDLGWCRHMSMSVFTNDPGALPHPMAVQEISKEFGFPEFRKCHVWVEDDIQPKAVNVLAKVGEEPDTRKLGQ